VPGVHSILAADIGQKYPPGQPDDEMEPASQSTPVGQGTGAFHVTLQKNPGGQIVQVEMLGAPTAKE